MVRVDFDWWVGWLVDWLVIVCCVVFCWVGLMDWMVFGFWLVFSGLLLGCGFGLLS